MKLYIVRHAAAEPPGGKPDSERALTFGGRKQAERTAEALAGLGAHPARLFASPAKRTMETARIIASVLDPKMEVEASPALASQGPLPVLELVKSCAELAEIAIVGHNPDLPLLCAALLAGPSGETIHFEPGSVWCVELNLLDSSTRAKLLWTRHPADM